MQIDEDCEIDGLLPFVGTMKNHAKVCRATAYGLLRSGKVEAVKVGSRTFIRKSELTRFLGTLPKYSAYDRVAA